MDEHDPTIDDYYIKKFIFEGKDTVLDILDAAYPDNGKKKKKKKFTFNIKNIVLADLIITEIQLVF